MGIAAASAAMRGPAPRRVQERPMIAVRPIARADWADWRRLWTSYLEFYETSVGEEVYDSSFARLLSGSEGEFSGLVCEIHGRVAGLAHYLFHRHMWKVENVCYLQDLFVEPEARGKGAGRALIEAVYRRADEAGCPGVYWLTQESNHAARGLYDKVGALSPFVKYGRR